MWLYLVANVAACKYDPGNTSPDGPRPDGEIPDAGPCQAINTKECVGDELRTCVTLGQLPEIESCSWGCSMAGAEPACLEILPAGGAVTTADVETMTLGDVVITGPAQLDTDSGTITVDGTPLTIGFAFRDNNAPEVGVFRFKSLSLAGDIEIVGSQALALVADGTITITGGVSVQGCTGGNGVRRAGPGGFNGAPSGQTNSTSGGGATGANTNGAGGGGHGGTGGTGGGTGGGIGGSIFGDATITMLVGGGGGGGGPGGGGGDGGGGGGAVQLVSNTSITISATGGINAGGCGGGLGAGGGSDGGGGAGAGGTILLEAPTIDLDGSLAVNGGGGGGSGGSPGTNGSNGALDRLPAPGGAAGAGGGGGAIGGTGAAGAGPNGGTGNDAGRDSGGGGGIGRIRLNARAIDVLDPTKLSPNLDDTNSTCTSGAASFQSS